MIINQFKILNEQNADELKKEAEELEKRATELKRAANEARQQENQPQTTGGNQIGNMATQMAITQAMGAGISKAGQAIGGGLQRAGDALPGAVDSTKSAITGKMQQGQEYIQRNLPGAIDQAKTIGGNISDKASGLFQQASQSGIGQNIGQHAGALKSAVMANPMLGGLGAAGLVGGGLLARRLMNRRRRRW